MELKRIITCVLTLFIFSSAIGQNNVINKLMGKWEAKDSDGITGSLHFMDSSKVVVTIPGQPLPQGNYIMDTTKTPMWFDINYKAGKNVLVMKGLLKLMNDSTLKWQIFNDGNRPENFTKGDSYIILKKKS